ncbi:MAG: hypothetical protein WCI39_03770 [Gallionellaceae bacterium]
MRYVTDIPTATRSPFIRQVTGLAAVYAVKPVHPRDQPIENIDRHAALQPELHQVEQHRDQVATDRRKACRRLNHQQVLIELRSGIDRRHHNVREGDVVEHIDIEA